MYEDVRHSVVGFRDGRHGFWVEDGAGRAAKRSSRSNARQIKARPHSSGDNTSNGVRKRCSR